MLQTLHRNSALLFPSYFLGQERNRSYPQMKKEPSNPHLLPPGIGEEKGKKGNNNLYSNCFLVFQQKF